MESKILFVALCLTLLVSCHSPHLSGTEANQRNTAAITFHDGTGRLQRMGDRPALDSPAVTLQCVDSKFCWINSPRIIWRSVDDGRTWKEVYGAKDDEEITACKFVQAENGWLITYDRLFVTDNGGLTWAEVESPFRYPNGQIRSLWLLDQTTGWLAGGVYRAQTALETRSGVPPNTKDSSGTRVLEETIYMTTDGGDSWRAQSLPKKIGRIMQLRFHDRRRGLALGERAIYYTGNSGESWHEVIFNKQCVDKEYLGEYYEGRPATSAMVDDRTWFVAYDDGRIVKTGDGGRNWCDLIGPGTVQFESEAGSPTYFEQLHLENPPHGWGLGSDRFLYETKDGGTQWSRVTSELRFDSMAFPGDQVGILVSDTGIFKLQSINHNAP